MTEANTGWIGLGAMGWPMAGHLHAAGLLKAVWNRTLSKSAAFAEQHPDTLAATTLQTLAERCQVIMLCVSADDDLAAVVDELLPALQAGQILVDHSTVSPATARKLAAKLAEREVGFIDAPVTGGVEGAIKGQLAIMAGGLWDTFQAVQPQLLAYARVTHHLGHAGSGQSAKAVNQLMVSGIAEAVCEALALMDKLDLPREHMLELLSGGAANSWFLEKRGRTMLADEFEVGFAPALLLKDLKICRSLCEET
ncbi:MAG: NAD(P)-dependent oxidoreductase, partial [Wenzhouxiangella sp.]|nr:NAD(P)-dependent oxidoreductase [Wenzhouxiangella sp.]